MANNTLTAGIPTDSSHHHGHHTPSFANINELVSRIAPFSGLIITIAAVVFAVVRLYGVEALFLRYVYSAKEAGQLATYSLLGWYCTLSRWLQILSSLYGAQLDGLGRIE